MKTSVEVLSWDSAHGVSAAKDKRSDIRDP